MALKGVTVDGVDYQFDYAYLANKPTIPSETPVATDSVAGKVKVGSGLTVGEDGTISIDLSSIVDGSTIVVGENGKIMVSESDPGEGGDPYGGGEC